MKYSDYLPTAEEIKLEISVEKAEKTTTQNTFGFTNIRVFWFKKMKGQNMEEYRDMPLEKVSIIENFWHSRNYLKIFAGLILVFISFGFFNFSLIISYILWILAFIFIIIGIILILNGLKPYGNFNIIGTIKTWEFQFQRRENIEKLQQFLKSIYYMIKPSQLETEEL